MIKRLNPIFFMKKAIFCRIQENDWEYHQCNKLWGKKSTKSTMIKTFFQFQCNYIIGIIYNSYSTLYTKVIIHFELMYLSLTFVFSAFEILLKKQLKPVWSWSGLLVLRYFRHVSAYQFKKPISSRYTSWTSAWPGFETS